MVAPSLLRTPSLRAETICELAKQIDSLWHDRRSAVLALSCQREIQRGLSLSILCINLGAVRGQETDDLVDLTSHDGGMNGSCPGVVGRTNVEAPRQA